ncbi:MAG: ABC transporter permease [Verrucomicrobiota bacterium]
MHRIRCLLIKELAQLRRDHRLFGILIVAPLIQLLLLGMAVDTDVNNITLAVRDQDHSFHSREFVRAVGASGYFNITTLSGPEREDGQLLVAGKAGVILVIPPDFGRNLARKQTASVQVLADGADSNYAVQGLNYLQKAARQFSDGQVRLAFLDAATQRGLPLPGVAVQTRVWFNPALKSRFYMLPALLGQLLMITTMMVTSMALVKEREEGTFEQLIVTPLRPLEMILGKLLPFVVVGIVEITLFLPLLRLVFGLPFHGQYHVLYGMTLLFLLTTLSLGLFISTLVKTLQQAMLVSTFFVMMPFLLLAGFAFPIANMPPAIQTITYLIPLRYYLEALRGIFLRGAGWQELWPQALALAAWGTALLALASLKFRKRLD